jgi:hypothetical protein
MLHEQSPLKRIIARFEYILNTYLREFVQLSIDDWVTFIRDFTAPNLSNDELWKINRTSLVNIHLHIKKKDKKKKVEKKKDAKKGGKDEPEEAEDEAPGKDGEADANRIIYKPSIQDCEDFIQSSMDRIVETTNKVGNLEADLMPFLQKQFVPNF